MASHPPARDIPAMLALAVMRFWSIRQTKTVRCYSALRLCR